MMDELLQSNVLRRAKMADNEDNDDDDDWGDAKKVSSKSDVFVCLFISTLRRFD